MAHFAVDERLAVHPKPHLAIKRGGRGAICLWTMTGSWVVLNRSDGFVPDVIAEYYSSPGKRGRQEIDGLVQSGMWTKEEGGYRFHDFGVYNFISDDAPKGSPEAYDGESPIERRRRLDKLRKAEERARQRSARKQDGPDRDDVQMSADSMRTDADSVRGQSGHCPDLSKDCPPPSPKPLSSEPDTNHQVPCESADMSADCPRTDADTHTGTSADIVRTKPTVPPRERLPEDVLVILARLRSHQALATVACVGIAEQIANQKMTGSKKMEWLLDSIDAAARDALATSNSGTPLSPAELAKMVVRYAGRARAPTVDGRRGAVTKQRSDGTDWTQTPRSKAAQAELDRKVAEQQGKGFVSLLDGLVDP